MTIEWGAILIGFNALLWVFLNAPVGRLALGRNSSFGQDHYGSRGVHEVVSTSPNWHLLPNVTDANFPWTQFLGGNCVHQCFLLHGQSIYCPEGPGRQGRVAFQNGNYVHGLPEVSHSADNNYSRARHAKAVYVCAMPLGIHEVV